MTEPDAQTPIDETVIRLRGEALDWLRVEQEVVVLDSEKDVYLNTNQTGAVLWQALSKGATREQLAKLLVDEFGIGEETARADTIAFVTALDERNLLSED